MIKIKNILLRTYITFSISVLCISCATPKKNESNKYLESEMVTWWCYLLDMIGTL